MSRLLQVHPPLPVQGNPHRRRPRRSHSGALRGLRHVREGLPGPREEDPSRPGACALSARQREKGLCIAGAVVRELLQAVRAGSACRGAEASRFCRRQRDRARRAGGQRRDRRVSRAGEARHLPFERLSGGRGLCEEICAGLCRQHHVGAFAAPVACKAAAQGVRRRYRRRVLRPLRREEERGGPARRSARPGADFRRSRRMALRREHRSGPDRRR